MRKLFVSIPMNGLSDDEIKVRMIDAKTEAERIMGQPMELLETVFDFPEGTPPLVYLGESLKKMAEADVVYFHHGWVRARGCVVERMAAMGYDKYIIAFGQDAVNMDGESDA